MASLIKREFQSGPVWYIQFYRAGRQKRIKASDNFQIAKEKLRRFNSAEARGEIQPLPTRTPVADVVTAYVSHIRSIKTAKSAQTDIYYLRDVFGPVCEALRISSTLRPYLDKQRLKSGKGPWFFRTPEGKRWEPDNFSAHLRAANREKKLPAWWTNLTFRHTFGSQLAMKGESLYKIATLMGNSPEICRRHYAALIPLELTGSVEFHEHRPAAQARSASA